MKPMKFGIIGAGMISEFHCRAVREEGHEVVAVADTALERAEAMCREQQIPRAYGSATELAADPEIEAVTIATPSGAHLEPMLTVMAAGKHVISEKPLEVTTARIDQAVAAARRHGVKLAGIFQYRTYEGPRRVKQAIEQGVFGKILAADVLIKYYRDQAYYEAARWRGTWALDGGGATMNQGSHWIDVLQWLVGPVTSVTGRYQTANHEIEADDLSHSLVTYANGAQGAIIATTCAYPGIPVRLEIHGTQGSVMLEDAHISLWAVQGQAAEHGRKPEQSGTSQPMAISMEGHKFHIRDFVEAIRQDRQPMVDGAEARKAVAIIEAIYQSSRSGQTISL